MVAPIARGSTALPAVIANPNVSSTRKKARSARPSGPLSKRERRAAPSTGWRRLSTAAVSSSGRVAVPAPSRATSANWSAPEYTRSDETSVRGAPRTPRAAAP